MKKIDGALDLIKLYIIWVRWSINRYFYILKGFLGGLLIKILPASAGAAEDVGLIFGSRRFPGGWNGNPLQCSCLENPTDGEAWWAAVHGVAKSQTRLSNFPFTFHFHALE